LKLGREVCYNPFAAFEGAMIEDAMIEDAMNRALLAITMGDPAGVGPEIVLKTLRHTDVYRRCRPLVLGDRRILERAAPWIGSPGLDFDAVDHPAAGRYTPGVITLLDLANAPPGACPTGQVSAAAGRAAAEYVFRACDLAMAGAVDAVVTAPLNKAAMNLAGFAYAGHTELLAERTGAREVSMLLVGPKLRVVHVSTHVALAEAIRRVTRARVETVIDLAHASCLALGIPAPRIAVAGLNPHAGEGGLFGDQEEREIQPAVRAARARGLNVSDPQPPDTVFLRAVKGEFDVVVAMYHDQGHIPMKLLAFDSGVNVSIGLPIIRTSVDHGTAFDIAGSGQAREDSLLAAIDVALQMVAARHTVG
jgi:4-hydroxythreonine-4-phosphate dehydrogenase